jgi:hypothetical protein
MKIHKILFGMLHSSRHLSEVFEQIPGGSSLWVGGLDWIWVGLILLQVGCRVGHVRLLSNLTGWVLFPSKLRLTVLHVALLVLLPPDMATVWPKLESMSNPNSFSNLLFLAGGGTVGTHYTTISHPAPRFLDLVCLVVWI